MNPAYATPPAFKMGMEQRLRNEALRTGTDLHRVRQPFVFDRFLARVFKVLDNAVVLKGGLALEMRLAKARTTRDVDLRVTGRHDSLLTRLQTAGRTDLGEFLTFEVAPDSIQPLLQAEGLPYGGRRFRAEARLAGMIYGAPFHVDVAIAEPLIGTTDILVGKDWLAFRGIPPTRMCVYPTVAHIAEKLHAYTLPRLRPNSRVKDLPDLALLATCGTLAGREVRTAIDRTFERRGTHPVPASVPEPLASWGPVYERMAAVDGLPWSSIPELVVVVRRFLDPILADASPAVTWHPGAWAWSP